MKEASPKRNFMNGIQEFDQVAFKHATKQRTEEDMKILMHIMTGASWNDWQERG